jgi:FkbM family methyltransferase
VWQMTGGLCHDHAVLAKALAHIEPGSIVIDGGAFNGDHAIAYAAKAGLVWAFEPQLPLFLNLCANIFCGQHFNVVPERAALGEIAGWGAFPDWIGAQENYGARRLAIGDAPSTVTSPIVRLDDHRLTAAGRVSFIKLDCEGFEPRILRGAASLIQRDHPAILIEVNQGQLTACGSSDDELLDLLRGLGYSHIAAVAGEAGSVQWDALCT